MRRYYRAALTIVASVSIVALLLYRHEYNKLHYVLEVLNYFGNPNVKDANCSDASITALSKLYNCTMSESSENYTYFVDPTPSWQRLTDEVYVYSAHRTGDALVGAVALAKLRRGKLALSCGVFFESEVDPVAGEFTYKLIDSSSGGAASARDVYQGYRLICDYTRNDEKKLVAAVKFSAKSSIQGGEEPAVTLAVRDFHADVKSDQEVAGVCVVMSNSKPLVDRDMINFISFHNALGIDRFVVYDFGVPARLNALTRRILWTKGAETSRLVSYDTLPWNFPFPRVSPEVFRSIAHTDCFYRTRGRVDVLVTLTWQEYIVLKRHSTITKLLRDFDKTEYAADRYEISSWNFCSNRKQGNSSLATGILVREKSPDANRPIFVYRQARDGDRAAKNENLVTRETGSDVVIVNRYEERCNPDAELETVSLDERYVGKFAKVAETTTLPKPIRVHGL